MPSNCTIISWKSKKKMASLLKGSKGGGGAPVARSGSGPGRCFSVFPKGPAPVAQRGLWHPSGLWPSVPRVVEKGCTPQGKRLTMICASLALLHLLLSLTHWIFRSLMLPYKSSSHSANHVRCASLRSGGRRLAVRTAMEHPIGALPCTPFASSRRSPQGETRK